MRVFVLNSGRCGSRTLYEACRKITNYTVAHTSRHQLLGGERIDYPDNHIELGNRLVWFLGRLDQRFPDACYVHLRRDPDAVAKSFAGRLKRSPDSGIIAAYASQIARQTDLRDTLPVSEDYVRTINENIAMFLKDKPHKMDFWLETYVHDFEVFWDTIGAQGDYAAALAEFAVRHNATQPATLRQRAPLRFLRRIMNLADT